MKRTGSLIIATAVIATGCGGGGGGYGGNPPVNPPSNFSITSANGQMVASVSYGAAVQSGDMAGLVGNSGLVADSGGGVSKPARSGQLSKSVTTAISSIPFGPDTLPCDFAGSMTVSGDLASPLTLTPGDVITIDANNCDDGLGEVIDGIINFRVDAFSGDFLGGLYDMTMRLDMTNFQVTTAEDTLLSNGDATVTFNTLTAPAVSASVSGTSMTTDSNSSSETMTSYLSAQSLNAGVTPSPYTMDSSATLDSSQFGGVVDYATTVMFEGFDTDYPGSGELLVTASDNTSARLIAIDNVNVRIEIDNDGDGMVDETINTTWVAITS